MKLKVPAFEDSVEIEIEAGRPVVLIGPNGSGKSRLGIYIDEVLALASSHRIAAQRSLEIPAEVFAERFDQAVDMLRRDKTDKRRKAPSPATMEYAFDQLLAALFAEHHRALETAYAASEGKAKARRPATLISQLQDIWKDLVPNRSLVFAERSIQVVPRDRKGDPFEGAELSDGERLVIYMLGQALLLKEGDLLIVDEPELHMSRALVVRLWDAVERVRPDCSFIYITHDVDFAASRRGARMYAVLDYRPPTLKEIVVRSRVRTVEEDPPCWVLQRLPTSLDLSSDMLVRIVGSRKPLLFVEGRTGGIDHCVYGAVYQSFTIIPVESCQRVENIVGSFRLQDTIHWLHCAGLVDRDHRVVDPYGRIEESLYALPVNEIENLFVLPDVFRALAQLSMFSADEINDRLERLKADVFDLANRDAELICLRQTSGRIWQVGGSIGVKARNIADLTTAYDDMVSRIKPVEIYETFRSDYAHILATKDYNNLLKIYSNKGGILNVLARNLDRRGASEMKSFIERALGQKNGEALISSLKACLPRIDDRTL